MLKKLLAICIVVLLLVGASHAFPRKVLFEEFTNTYCGPCASAAPTVYAFMENNFDDLAILVWHGWWPGSGDPWYQNNINDNTNRINHYGVSGVPDAFMGGVLEPSPFDGGALQNAFNERIAMDSPVEIVISSSGGASSGITINVNVNSADEAVSGSYILRVATVEGLITYAAPNGQNEWGYAVIDVAPSMSGDPFSIDANSTETFTYNLPWNDDFYDEENLYITAWIQDTATDEVLQSGMEEFAQAYGLAATPSGDAAFVNPMDEAEFTLDLLNQGQEDDIYDVEIITDLPDGWDFTYTTPDGEQSGNSTISLASAESFTSDITFTTNEQPGAGGMVNMTLTSQGMPALTMDFDFYVVSSSEILVLNSNPTGEYGEYYGDAIAAHEELNPDSYAHWQEMNAAFPGADLAESDVECVIWFNGGTSDPLNDSFVAALENYLLAGGSALVTGKTMPGLIVGAELNEWFGFRQPAQYNMTNEMTVDGVEGDPIFDGVSFNLGGGDGSGTHERPTAMQTYEGGEEALLYDNVVIRRAAIRNESLMRTLIFGFPFEAIASEDERNQLMAMSLNWLMDFTDVDDDAADGTLPAEYSLGQNYPNPFNPSTSIAFTLPERANVTLAVFDLMGREVARLANGTMDAGSHKVTWDAANMPSGVYFYRMETASFQATQKMLLIK